MIGHRLGQYEIVAKLGEGGMGEVYRALDTKLGRSVAIKVISEACLLDADRVARFDREAKVLASLFSSWSWSKARRSRIGCGAAPCR